MNGVVGGLVGAGRGRGGGGGRGSRRRGRRRDQVHCGRPREARPGGRYGRRVFQETEGQGGGDVSASVWAVSGTGPQICLWGLPHVVHTPCPRHV
jgi:hypothetical protein